MVYHRVDVSHGEFPSENRLIEEIVSFPGVTLLSLSESRNTAVAIRPPE